MIFQDFIFVSVNGFLAPSSISQFLYAFFCFLYQLAWKVKQEQDDDLEDQALAAATYDYAVGRENVFVFHFLCKIEGEKG